MRWRHDEHRPQVARPLFSYSWGLIRLKLVGSAAAKRGRPRAPAVRGLPYPSASRGGLLSTCCDSLPPPTPGRRSAVASVGREFVGPYRLFHLIRASSAYEIWAVRPPAENVAYALKWLPRGEKYTREAVNGLRHEFVVGQTLQHPAIIKTYAFETSSADGAYLVMELFKAPNLKQRLQMGLNHIHYRIEKILTTAAEGMEHMHSVGWIHRDIKPDNFLVDDENHVKLIDFNLAQKRKGALGRLIAGKSKVQGTMSYMSPEQIRGLPAEPQADIYSFGCMMHELVSGKPPFTGTSSNELLTRHLRSRPQSLTVFDKNVEPAFADLVLRTIAKDPAQRPESFKQLLKELAVTKIFRIRPKPPEAAEVIEE